MVKTFYYLLKEIRPRQWIKNLIIFSAIFFTGEIFTPSLLFITFEAFIIFCLASSSMYIFNDLNDIEKDRLHPFKKNRPLASGKLNKKLVITTALIASTVGLYWAYNINLSFFFTLIIFYVLQFSYSIYLKHIVLLDIFAIAAGFILRVFAGEVATGFHIDIWLFLTVVSVSLFLAIGKRRSELTLLSGWEGTAAAKTRITLSRYSEKMLDVYISMFANSAWITYAFYTFLQRPPILRSRIGFFFEQYNLEGFQDKKWLMITIPFAIYGIMRYLQLIYEKNEGESPEKVMLSDRPLIITAAILGSLLFAIIYIIRR
jgi:decaprenyl-phosphate phosphoribosyltransferase